MLLQNLNFILILTVLYLVCCGLCESQVPTRRGIDIGGLGLSLKKGVEMGRAIQSVLNPLGTLIKTNA